jgi:hypothetical protein
MSALGCRWTDGSSTRGAAATSSVLKPEKSCNRLSTGAGQSRRSKFFATTSHRM